MTSRDLTENVEQLQIVSALKIIRDRIVATLVQLAQLASQYADQPMAGRTHNVRGAGHHAREAFRNGGE